MVAGDSRRIVVIRNISSNLIEEAILILRNRPDEPETPARGKPKRAGRRGGMTSCSGKRSTGDYMRSTDSPGSGTDGYFGIFRLRIHAGSVVTSCRAAALLPLSLSPGCFERRRRPDNLCMYCLQCFSSGWVTQNPCSAQRMQGRLVQKEVKSI